MQNVKLNMKTVENLKLGKYRDTENRTLQIWIGTKSKTWYFEKKYHFKTVRCAIGKYPQTTRDMAIQQINVLLSNLTQFGMLNPQQNFSPKKNNFTMEDAILLYQKERKIHSRTILRYLNVLKDRSLESITRDDFIDLNNQISSRGALIMANRTMAIARAIINTAIAEGKYHGENPASHIRKNPETPRQRYLLPSEAPHVIECLLQMRQSKRTRDGADALLLMLYTWQRKSNVLAMEWAEVDETGIWTIPAAKAKARKDIVVALTRESLDLLKERKNNTPWVFPHKKNPSGHISDIKTMWGSLRKKCNLKDFHIHDLRHTGATYALRSGADITTVSSGLAHASVSFTAKVYAHVMVESKKEAARGAIDAMTGKIQTK